MVQDPVFYPAEYREAPEVRPSDLKPLTDNAKTRLWYDLCQALNIRYLED